MSRLRLCVLVLAVTLSHAVMGMAQESDIASKGAAAGLLAVSTVPRLVKFSGALQSRKGEALGGVITRLSFSIYEEQSGGAALWSEAQDVRLDAQGRYAVLLGAASSDGLPADLFSTAGARWLGVQAEGREEESRVLLVAVPYALKAADADTLGGKPATAFVATDQLKDQVRSEVTTQIAQPGTGQSTRTLIGTAPSPQALGEGQSSFVCNLAADCVKVTQSGAGVGLHATTPTGASVLGELSGTSGAAVYGRATAGTGAASAVQGDAANPNGAGVLGRNFATTGVASGVFGRSFSTSGVGVRGDATTATGATRGVWGTTVSTGGVGVYGQSSSPTGFTTGVSGTVASTSGVGVLGQANAASGTTTGVQAKVLSAAGTALVADNVAGGKIFSGQINGVQKFYIDGSGNGVASGTLTGTRLISTVATGTAPITAASITLVPNLNADLVDGLHAASFATLGGNTFVGSQSVTGNIGASGTAGFTGGLTVGTDFLVAANGRTTTPSISVQLPNNGSQGTVLNHPAILTGSPSTVSFTNHYTGGLVGIVTGGSGNTGNAQVGVAGRMDCDFDGPTTAGDYVQFAPTGGTGGCHDAGPALPPVGQVLGRVLTTNGGAGTYPILMYGPEQRAPSVTDNLLFHASFANYVQSNVGTASVVPNDGFVTLSTGATASSVADIENQTAAGLTGGLNRAFMSARVGWNSSISPQHIFYVLGGGHSGGVPLAAGMGFKAVGSALKGFTSDANTAMSTVVDLGTTLASGVFVDLLAIRRSGAVDFYVNGLLKGTNTTNLPSGSNATYELRVENGSSATNAILQVGFLTVGIKMFCSQGGCAY